MPLEDQSLHDHTPLLNPLKNINKLANRLGFVCAPIRSFNPNLRLGAVYYNPLLGQAEKYARWLGRPDLRFAAAYQPTVYHPSFEGRDEARWWPSVPDIRYSALSEARRHGPVAREGKIPMALYRWLEIKVPTGEISKPLRIFFDNPRGEALLEVVPLNAQGRPLDHQRRSLSIPARWRGWQSLDLGSLPPHTSLRLLFPRDSDRCQIGGLTFGEDGLHWPWAQKALLTFQPRENGGGPITVSFDPAALLPEPLRSRRITVLDDKGSSVLLELQD